MKNSETKNIQSHSINTGLCDGFLIPMTDFVNAVGNMENYPSHEKALSWIYNYATFLKQPLKLEMFVPCDEMMEVMNYEEIKQSVIEGTDSWDAYEKAKEKVLFEGFYWVGNYAVCMAEDEMIYIDDEFMQNMTIDKFLTTIITDLQLTPSALDAIFGETVA